jgi:hypothetical protein
VGHDTNGVINDTNHNGVITTTMRLPAGSNAGAGDNDSGHRHGRRTGNDDSGPINITDDTFKRRPQPSVLAPPSAVTPMTVNPAGSPPSASGPSPLAPRTGPSLPRQDANQDGDPRRFWTHRNPDNRNPDNRNPEPPPGIAPAMTAPRTGDVNGGGRFQRPSTPPQTEVPTPPQIQPPVIAPPQAIPAPGTPADVSGYGQFRAPRTGNMGSVPADGGGYGRFQRPNPAGPTPQMPSTPVQTFQPPAPIQTPQPMAVAPSPQTRSVDVPGVGRVQVPANVGQGNVGQGNVGQGNVGQGNVGQPAGGNFGR